VFRSLIVGEILLKSRNLGTSAYPAGSERLDNLLDFRLLDHGSAKDEEILAPLERLVVQVLNS
jgi:hypothetical protein